MLNKLLSIVLLSAFMLTACTPKAVTPMPLAGGPPMSGCKVNALLPAINPTVQALIPAVSADEHILGAKDALVTIVEYSDFQCPYCSMLAPTLTKLVEKYPKDLRLVYRFFPLSSHSNALISAYAAEAAGRQDKFFEFNAFLFANQAKWGGLSTAEATAWFAEQSSQFKMDAEKFKADIASDSVRQVVDKSLKIAMDAQIPGTPFLMINGLPYQANMDIDSLSAVVALHKLSQAAYKECPPMVIDPKRSYTATLKTAKGDIVVKLFADKAPLAVNSFVFLARKGFYNDTSFYRVVKNILAEAGDPSGSDLGGPGYAFVVENKDAVFNRAGLLVMAKDNDGTNDATPPNGSRFFITFAEAKNLNGTYTQFGEVLSGLDIAQELTLREPTAAGTSPLPPADRLISVEISEK